MIKLKNINKLYGFNLNKKVVMKITEKTTPNSVSKKVNNNWQKFTTSELKEVVVNVNKLKTDTAKYSSEGLAKNVPLVKSIQSFRNKLRLFAKDVLRVNDVEDYISKNWNRKNIRKQIFDNINYPPKDNLDKPIRNWVFEHLVDRSVDIAISLEMTNANYGLQLLKDSKGEEKFVVVSNKAYPKLQQKSPDNKEVDWVENKSEKLIPLTTRLLEEITSNYRPKKSGSKGSQIGKGIGKPESISKQLDQIKKDLDLIIKGRVKDCQYLIDELNDNDIKTLDAIIKTSLRIKEVRSNDVRNANKDNINENEEMVVVANVQYQINNNKGLAIKNNKLA
jgi:hypothetical protein